MANPLLIPFWIHAPDENGPLGFGVTAFSLDDGIRIIREFGYKLPDDISQLRFVEGVRVSELDQNHIVPNMGPIVVRGLWYPFHKIGV